MIKNITHTLIIHLFVLVILVLSTELLSSQSISIEIQNTFISENGSPVLQNASGAFWFPS